ncbi:hypothetical protein KAR91_12610 [Candidatus Pacearchaeota archaeon]|nr:hypothetical protein [Candidatus Pacearchaeota archaeon]
MSGKMFNIGIICALIVAVVINIISSTWIGTYIQIGFTTGWVLIRAKSMPK